MEKMYKSVGERIFMVRSLRGYSREHLAEIADISPSFSMKLNWEKRDFPHTHLQNSAVRWRSTVIISCMAAGDCSAADSRNPLAGMWRRILLNHNGSFS